MKVHISNGNGKIMHTLNVSLPPVITCPDGVPCADGCYALNPYRRFRATRAAWDGNLEAYRQQPAEYFLQIEAACAGRRYFRWHVSGDIPDMAYLIGMVWVAQSKPETIFLAFTKRFNIVNEYLDLFGSLPVNLRIVFSAWGDGFPIPNPYNLPVAQVVFVGCLPQPGWIRCWGNCELCQQQQRGCWFLQPGEVVYFPEHGTPAANAAKRKGGKKA